MMGWLFYELAINQLEAWLTFYFMSSLFEKKYSPKVTYGVVVLQGLLFWGIERFISPQIGSLSLIVIMATTLCLYKVLLDALWSRLLLFLLLYVVIVASVEVLTFGLVSSIYQHHLAALYQDGLYRVAAALFSRTLIFVIIRLLRKRKVVHANLRKVYIYEFSIILIANLSFFVVVLNMFKDRKLFFNNSLIILGMSVFLILFTALIIKIIDEILKYSQKEFEWDIIEREYEQQINYIHSLDELMRKLKAQRHDFNLHIGCLHGLLDNGDYEDARSYASDLVLQMNRQNDVLRVDNPIIGALLHYKLSQAEDKGIFIEADIHIPKKLPFEPIDISIIMGNALDNAIEACLKTNEKFVRIHMRMEQRHLFIKVENSTPPPPDQELSGFKTSKADSENHGFGLSNIQFAVEKYDGLMQTDWQESRFILNIALHSKMLQTSEVAS